MRRIRSMATVAGLMGVLATAVVPAGMAGAAVTTRYVDDDGRASVARGCNGGRAAFTTIQPAVVASGPGDRILVCPGTYRGFVTILADRPGLVIRAVRPGTATLAPFTALAPLTRPGGSAPAGSSELLRISAADGVVVRGLRFAIPAVACVPLQAVVRVDAGATGVLLQGLRIVATGTATYRGPCGYLTGVDVSGASSVRVIDSRVRDFREHGIRAMGAGTALTVTRTTVRFVHANEAAVDACAGDGVMVGDDARGVVEDSLVSGTSTASDVAGTPLLCQGIGASGSAGIVLRRTTIAHSLIGVYVAAAQDPLLSRLSVLDPRRDGVELDQVTGGEVRRVTIRRAPGLGFEIHGASSGIFLHDNDARGPGNPDCSDETSGAGTAGTANTWRRNLGGQSQPAGICKPPA